MARVLGLEEVDTSLRSAVAQSLRLSDEAIVLPSASRSDESGSFKNVVFKLRGDEADLNPSVFECSLFCGLSAVAVDEASAKRILANRKEYATKLAESIPSELADAELAVGPALDGDAADRDAQKWECGFDGPSSFVGIFSAEQIKPPCIGAKGMSRAHPTFFLVTKAGGGAAVSTFQARLTAALKGGKTLDQIFDGDGPLGGGALRRATAAGSRNRAMILARAARVLGVDIDSLNDSASAEDAPQRVAIPIVDVQANVLRKDGAYWQFSTCVDSSVSQGLCSLSSATEGVILYADKEASLKTSVVNEAGSCVPFSTPRIKGPRALVVRAAEETHPDAAFVQERFSWKEKQVGQREPVVPPSLWGSHAAESFLASWARELGLAALQPLRLRPEVVAIASAEPAKLRAVARKK